MKLCEMLAVINYSIRKIKKNNKEKNIIKVKFTELNIR